MFAKSQNLDDAVNLKKEAFMSRKGQGKIYF